jgi:hypothetical protein
MVGAAAAPLQRWRRWQWQRWRQRQQQGRKRYIPFIKSRSDNKLAYFVQHTLRIWMDSMDFASLREIADSDPWESNTWFWWLDPDSPWWAGVGNQQCAIIAINASRTITYKTIYIRFRVVFSRNKLYLLHLETEQEIGYISTYLWIRGSCPMMGNMRSLVCVHQIRPE